MDSASHLVMGWPCSKAWREAQLACSPGTRCWCTNRTAAEKTYAQSIDCEVELHFTKLFSVLGVSGALHNLSSLHPLALLEGFTILTLDMMLTFWRNVFNSKTSQGVGLEWPACTPPCKLLTLVFLLVCSISGHSRS